MPDGLAQSSSRQPCIGWLPRQSKVCQMQDWHLSSTCVGAAAQESTHPAVHVSISCGSRCSGVCSGVQQSWQGSAAPTQCRESLATELRPGRGPRNCQRPRFKGKIIICAGLAGGPTSRSGGAGARIGRYDGTAGRGCTPSRAAFPEVHTCLNVPPLQRWTRG